MGEAAAAVREKGTMREAGREEAKGSGDRWERRKDAHQREDGLRIRKENGRGAGEPIAHKASQLRDSLLTLSVSSGPTPE